MKIGEGQLATVLVGLVNSGPEAERPPDVGGDLLRGGPVRVGAPETLLGRGVVVVVVPDPDGHGVQVAEGVRAGEVYEELGRTVALLGEGDLELRGELGEPAVALDSGHDLGRTPGFLGRVARALGRLPQGSGGCDVEQRRDGAGTVGPALVLGSEQRQTAHRGEERQDEQ
ncbi:hypothetical protein [Streptomyces sp. NPDC085529]|uniref:hypothetical protein n=1 Tax=Streptomyces sp. NPDC085529 TaxID=3365729 RepID=UPI0037D7FC2A